MSELRGELYRSGRSATTRSTSHRKSPPARAGATRAQSGRREDTGRRFLRTLMQVFLASGLSGLVTFAFGIWLQGGGVTSLRSGADLLTSLGQITGLLATVSLLLQLLLMARLPFIEFAYGWARTSAWHKLNGKICLGLVLSHVSLVVIGYAGASNLSITAEAGQMLDRLYGATAAVIGTLAMILVVVTSLVIVRRRLRYELWYMVHLLAYVALILTWFHQIPTSALFAANPGAAALWTALFVGTIQLTVLFRFGQPVARLLIHRVRVTEVKQEGNGVVTIRMTGRHLDWFNARAGQFFIWRFLAAGFWYEAHPFSLSMAPDGRSFRISVKAVGDFTARLASLKPDTRVLIEGPFGSFTEEVRGRDRVAMIAGGIGITPIRALLEEIQGAVTLVYRVAHQEEAHLRAELDELIARRGGHVHYVVGDHRDPRNRDLLSRSHLKSLLPDIGRSDVYLCGPPPMMRSVEANLRRLGVTRNRIHRDAFSL